MTSPVFPPVPRLVQYNDIRNDIRDGDLFLFRGNFRSSKIFEKLFKSYYSHAAIIAWWGHRPMILQAEGSGIEAIPLSVMIQTYPGRVDWYRLKRDTISEFDQKLLATLHEARSDLGLPFGVWELFARLTQWLTKVKFTNPVTPRGMFCSMYVERCFRTGGMPLGDQADIEMLPAAVARSPLVEYAATVQHDDKAQDPRVADLVIR